MFAKALCNLQISFWTWNLQTRCPYPMETLPDLTPTIIQHLPLWSEVSVNDPDRYPHLLSVKNCFIRGISFHLCYFRCHLFAQWLYEFCMKWISFAVWRIRGTICPFAGAWGNFSLIKCLDFPLSQVIMIDYVVLPKRTRTRRYYSYYSQTLPGGHRIIAG